ncbi:sigma-70 family RNA polymerase sigma factor [Aquabacter sp. CN5-332]|uniref:RNA polymerase sigma factor n=1 Tax=Aquabacter sp. CN5-332 TaxID=3156608 RepID=UPI0032B595CE
MSWDLHTLFRRHSQEIARSLRRRGVTSETAADLTQETFLRLLAAGSQEVTHDNPRALLHRIARNLRIDLQRREGLMPRADLTSDELATVPDDAPSPEVIVFDRQRLAITAAALQELPERTRRAFEMHRLGEKTISEAAQELGLSTTRTWALIRDAYRHIRARLHEAD